jgi:cob(I)alamin adenosyltransferase
MRIDKVYTKQGDRGMTSLPGGASARKDSPRIECYGSLDGLNATLGLVRTALADSAAGPRLLPIVARIQNELFNLGTQVATPSAARRAKSPAIEERHIKELEGDIDALNQELSPLTSFVLPGGGWVSSYLHLSRTTCRQCERLLVGLAQDEDVGELVLAYVNRLSDALFVFGRWAAIKDGEAEVLWEPEST